MKTIWLLVFAVVAVMMIAPCLEAQTSQGRILGTVTDSSGAVVAKAKVTITNTATGIARTIATTAAGEYAAPNLEPGAYEVVVEAAGFTKARHTAVTLEVARDVRVDIKLVPGAVTEIMLVTGEVPIVDTTSDVLGSTFSNEAINEPGFQQHQSRGQRNSKVGLSPFR